MEDRPPLFVPLRAEFFRAFAAGTKTVEWRKLGNRYNERTLYKGRAITLGNGYSGARLYGRVVKLELRVASEVVGAADIYGPTAMLIGIHVKLRSHRPQ